MKTAHYRKHQKIAMKEHFTQDLTLKQGLNAHVVGAGRSGRAAVHFLLALGMKVTLHENDFSTIPIEFKTFLKEQDVTCISGEHVKENFLNCEVLIPSPGIPISKLMPFFKKTEIEKLQGKASHKTFPTLFLSETELAWLYCKEIPVLAITGTSGKTTTTTLCTAMLESADFKVFTGGNIGTPLCEFALEYINNSQKAKETQILVLELSSAQLQTCNILRPQVAVCLNITENHLDYHIDMQEYIRAKMNIFANQTEEDFVVWSESMRQFHPTLQTEYRIKGQIIFFDSSITRFPNTKLLGMHNQNNAEAAWQACHIFGVTEEEATKAMANILPMENRLELVAEHKGVTYINDSKGTTVDAVKVALLAVKEAKHPICLLMGGKFKGGDLSSLIPLMKNNVKHIALFGGYKDVFMKAFSQDFENSITWDTTMKEAIMRLQKIVEGNDAVLLSPATSSFDQYKNYEARGEDFRQIVRNIINQ